MKDWKGNIIKIGDTLSVYQFMNPFAGQDIYILKFTGDSSIEKIGVFPNDYQWTLISRIKIIAGNRLIFEINKEYNPSDIIEAPMCFAALEYYKSRGYAICIDGVSDNRDEFMLNYFT